MNRRERRARLVLTNHGFKLHRQKDEGTWRFKISRLSDGRYIPGSGAYEWLTIEQVESFSVFQILADNPRDNAAVAPHLANMSDHDVTVVAGLALGKAFGLAEAPACSAV
jgi:hypothetical protein